MPIRTRGRVAAAASLIAVLSVGALPAQAAAPFDILLPAGLACEFELGVNITSSEHQVDRTFTDAQGNVRTLVAGKGDALTFTNVSTGAEVSLRGNGSVIRTAVNPDGSQTVVSTGHAVLILFPNDVPAGPTTTLYVGRLTYEVSPGGVYTVTGASGPTRDICEELTE